MPKQYQNFKEFYPFYLSQHQNPTCRLLHIIGTSIGIICFVCAIFFWQWKFLLLALISGYAFAWIGHFFFEKNRPATFTYPWYSFMADFVMWAQTILFFCFKQKNY